MALRPGNLQRLNRLQQMQQGGQALSQQQQNAFNTLTQRQQQQGYGARRGGGGQGMNFNTPRGVIRAQGQENINAVNQTNQLANPNVQGVYGNQTITYDENGRPTVTQALSPEQQALQAQEYGLESGANTQAQGIMNQGLYNQPFSATGVQQAFSPIRNEVMDSLYKDFEQQYEPQFQQEREQLEQWAANTGNGPGSPLYEARSRQLAENQNRARQSARAQAIGMGTQAVESGFRLGQEARDRPYQEVSNLMGLGRGVQDPNFQTFQSSAVSPVDIGGIATTFRGQNISAQNARLGAGTSAQLAREEREWAERMMQEEEDRRAGGDTSSFVGGGVDAAMAPATRSARGGGGLSSMGRAIRTMRGRRRR